jgi:undecaprenyl-diphosphatase
MTTAEAVILAVVEGLTEYLPISSTGQMVIASSLMGISADPFTKDYTVIVQFGAILAVLTLYWRRFVVSKDIYLNLLVGCAPVLAIGFIFKDQINDLLGDVVVVAWAQIIGGVILLFIDRIGKNAQRFGIDDLTPRRAGFIGIIQCLALIPGTSRSAATIIGGMLGGMTRTAAAEYSFLLAVPTLTAATAWKTLKIYKTIEPEQVSTLIMGNLVAFVIAILTIKAFVGFLTRRGFFIFGIYRILTGAVILGLLWTGHRLDML